MEFEQQDDYQTIAEKISDSIISMYKLYATNLAACNLLEINYQDQIAYSSTDIEEAEKVLQDRLKNLENGARSKLLEQYANPVVRKLQLS